MLVQIAKDPENEEAIMKANDKVIVAEKITINFFEMKKNIFFVIFIVMAMPEKMFHSSVKKNANYRVFLV